MGHFCHVCGRSRPNEKFSGQGHKKHVCKDCLKKPVGLQSESSALNRIYDLYHFSNLSKNNRQMLKSYLDDESEHVRTAAQAALDHFSHRRYHECHEISLYANDTDLEICMESENIEIDSLNDSDNIDLGWDDDDLPF